MAGAFAGCVEGSKDLAEVFFFDANAGVRDNQFTGVLPNGQRDRDRAGKDMVGLPDDGGIVMASPEKQKSTGA